MKSILTFLAKWNATTDAFGKVQGAYLALAAVLFVVAAFTSLISAPFGATLLFYAFVAAMIAVANGVIWAILRTFVIERLNSIKTTKTRKK